MKMSVSHPKESKSCRNDRITDTKELHPAAILKRKKKVKEKERKRMMETGNIGWCDAMNSITSYPPPQNTNTTRLAESTIKNHK